MSETILFERLDLLVDDCAGALGDWSDVLRRSGVALESAPAPRRPYRFANRRALVWAFVLATLLVILFATPAFGLLRDWIGRKDVPFTGKTAPVIVKRDFDDLSIGMPGYLDPQAIASQTRKVGVFQASGDAYTLYVSPTQKGGFCAYFSSRRERTFSGECRQTRPTAKDLPNGNGAVNPYLLRVFLGQYEVSGFVFAENATSLSLEYEDGSSGQIPFVYVSKPINAGFFLRGIGQGVESVSARDSHGKLIARWTSYYSPPKVISDVTPRKLSLPSTAKPPLQHGHASGVSAVAGKNGVVIFDLSGASEKVRAVLEEGADTGCFSFTPYHQESPVGVGGGFIHLTPRVVQVFPGLKTPFDACTIGGRYGHRWPDRFHSHSAVEIAFTARAKAYFADSAAAEDLTGFVRRIRKIRRLSGDGLDAAISHSFGTAITHLASSANSLPPERIGYVDRAGGAIFIEYSTTGRRFYVTLANGKIAAENVRGLTYLN